MDPTGEIDSRHHWKLPHHRRFSRDGERVLVVERRIVDAHGHITRRQPAFLERREGGAIRAIIALDQHCFEHISPRPRWASWYRFVSMKPKRYRRILAIDIGGSHVKMRVYGRREMRQFESGPDLTPGQMVAHVHELTGDWIYDAVSIGYPGVVLHGKVVAEPHNLGKGWVGFDFRKAFGRPAHVLNDAAMQAVGSYEGGKMLFLSLGTGLGSTLIVDGTLEPMELGHLPFRKATFEDYVGERGLQRLGKKRWRRAV